MDENHQHDSSDDWTTYDNKFVHPRSMAPKKSNIGLVFILALIMGMFFYIGSFYWDRTPLPEVSKKQKSSESYFDLLPIPSFEKHTG